MWDFKFFSFNQTKISSWVYSKMNAGFWSGGVGKPFDMNKRLKCQSEEIRKKTFHALIGFNVSFICCSEDKIQYSFSYFLFFAKITTSLTRIFYLEMLEQFEFSQIVEIEHDIFMQDGCRIISFVVWNSLKSRFLNCWIDRDAHIP